MAGMSKGQDRAGLPRRRSDQAIAAAVGDDPDEAPLRTEAMMEAARRQELLRDIHGVLRLRRRLRVGQIAFANRYGIPLGTLRNWEQGRSEPDRAAKVLLAAIATDPEGIARAAAHAGDPAYLASGPRQAA